MFDLIAALVLLTDGFSRKLAVLAEVALALAGIGRHQDRWKP